mgnify:CR=1 FL=1
MARRPMVLVTGGSGEMAHGLIHRFAESGTVDVVALDVRPLDPEVTRRCAVSLTGDIRDRRLLERLRSELPTAQHKLAARGAGVLLTLALSVWLLSTPSKPHAPPVAPPAPPKVASRAAPLPVAAVPQTAAAPAAEDGASRPAAKPKAKQSES